MCMEMEKRLVYLIISDKIDIKTMAITRNKEGSSKFTSGYLSEETQNTNSKRHMHFYIHYSTIYNSPDMGNLSAHQ